MAYSSKYYDPQKAHEYYMKTRELKGYENRYGGSRGDGTSAASTPGYLSDSIKQLQNSVPDTISSQLTNNQNIQKQIRDLQQQLSQHINNTRVNTESLINELNSMSPEDRNANRNYYQELIEHNRQDLENVRNSISDQIQRLQQNTTGGSTSGFNQKGMEAAMYIKKQMEEERDDIIKKTNKDTDDNMLNDVKKLAADIKAMRDSGRGFSHKEFASRIKILLGEAKKSKIKAKKKYIREYIQKYKDEIDKLRRDDSMFSYWDKRNSQNNVTNEQVGVLLPINRNNVLTGKIEKINH